MLETARLGWGAVRVVLIALASLSMHNALAADDKLTALATVSSGALLESADGQVIGSLAGRSFAYDERGTWRGAYSVLSSRGYFAVVLPGGELGQVTALVYGDASCGGTPAVEVVGSGETLPVLPGTVFAFGAPAHTWQVSADTRADEFVVASRQERSGDTYRCRPFAARAMVYALAANRREHSGIANSYAAPVRVRVLARNAMPSAQLDNRPQPMQTGAGAIFSPSTAQCAEGCFVPYLGDGICEVECANGLCDFDASDCSADFVSQARKHEAALCAPTCEATDLGDGFCDRPCNVAACNFDRDDCAQP